MLSDGIAGLASLEAGSVNLLLSDLPSGETRAAFDRRADLPRLWSAIAHAVAAHRGGVVVLMASSFAFAADIRDAAPFSAPLEPLDLVWEKSMGTGHLNTRHRPLKTHEFILVWAPAGSAYHPQMSNGASPIHAARQTSHGENYGPQSRVTESRAGATDRYPTTVLHFASVGTTAPERVHPQQKPVPLLRYLIETYSNPGDLVADPYAGSGSTGVAALACGRRFVGWDDCHRFGRAA